MLIENTKPILFQLILTACSLGVTKLKSKTFDNKSPFLSMILQY